VPCAQIQIGNSPNVTLTGFTLQGNFRDHGFGFNWGNVSAPHMRAGIHEAVDDDNFPNGSAWTDGIFVAGTQCDGLDIHDVDTKDLGVYHIALAGLSAWTVTDVVMRQTDPYREYLQWCFSAMQTTGGTATRVRFDGDYVTPSHEILMGICDLIDCGSRNGTLSINSGGGFLIQDWNAVFEANSLVEANFINRNIPTITVNTNNGGVYSHLGGDFLHVNVEQQGFVKENFSMIGMVVAPGCPDVTVDDFTNTAPNYVPGAPMHGAQAIASFGPDFIVRNSTFNGTAAWTAANNYENRAVLYLNDHNAAECVNLTLPDDPNSKFYGI